MKKKEDVKEWPLHSEKKGGWEVSIWDAKPGSDFRNLKIQKSWQDQNKVWQRRAVFIIEPEIEKIIQLLKNCRKALDDEAFKPPKRGSE